MLMPRALAHCHTVYSRLLPLLTCDFSPDMKNLAPTMLERGISTYLEVSVHKICPLPLYGLTHLFLTLRTPVHLFYTLGFKNSMLLSVMLALFQFGH